MHPCWSGRANSGAGEPTVSTGSVCQSARRAVRVRCGSVPMRGVLVELLPCGEAMKERVDAEGVARFPAGAIPVRRR